MKASRQQKIKVPSVSGRYLFLLIITLLAQQSLQAQADTSASYNKTYYEGYPRHITARTYFSQKYTSLVLRAAQKTDDLHYRPNTSLNFGVGATYGWFTLNLAYGFGFLNKGDNPKGKTRYIDLQSHVYTRKMSIDIFGQFYKGFYVHPNGTVPAVAPGAWYVRPDLKVRHMGVAAYYIVDWRKLSMRAAMLQTEWQKKSAGSLLVGGEAYYGYSKADSAMVPANLKDRYAQEGVTKFRYFDIGPGIGYAYTFVYQENYYAMGGLTATLPFNFHKEYKAGVGDKRFSISPDFVYRVGLGYSNEKMNISMTWVNNTFETKGPAGKYQIRTGNVRLNAAYRFLPTPKIKKMISPFNTAS